MSSPQTRASKPSIRPHPSHPATTPQPNPERPVIPLAATGPAPTLCPTPSSGLRGQTRSPRNKQTPNAVSRETGPRAWTLSLTVAARTIVSVPLHALISGCRRFRISAFTLSVPSTGTHSIKNRPPVERKVVPDESPSPPTPPHDGDDVPIPRRFHAASCIRLSNKPVTFHYRYEDQWMR